MEAADETSPKLEDVFPSGPLFKFLSVADGQPPPWKERFAQLLRGEAYLPSPLQFNDPFDCMIPVVLPETMDAFNARKEEFYQRLERAMPEMPPDRIRAIDGHIQSFGLTDLHRVTTRSFERGTAKMGVYCLAEGIENVLMWSHYADHHRGIALRFHFKPGPGSGLSPLFKVRYQKERPSIEAYFGGADRPEDITDALRTKAEDWHYEREWRFLEPDGAGTTVTFDPKIITGVILGARTSDDDAFWLLDQCIKSGIPLMKAMMHSEKFEMIFHGAYDPAAKTA